MNYGSRKLSIMAAKSGRPCGRKASEEDRSEEFEDHSWGLRVDSNKAWGSVRQVRRGIWKKRGVLTGQGRLVEKAL